MDREPYSKDQIHRTKQAEDEVYNDQDAELSLARINFVQPGNVAAGLRADLLVAVDPSASPAPSQRRGRSVPPQDRRGG